MKRGLNIYITDFCAKRHSDERSSSSALLNRASAIFFLLCFSTLGLFAQNGNKTIVSGAYSVKDSFDDNRNLWDERNTDKFLQKIKDGAYLLKNRTTSSSYMFSNRFYINTRYDFSIETDLKLNYREGKGMYCIIWGSENWNNNFQWLLSKNGTFQIGKTQEKFFRTLVEQTPCEDLKKEGTYNRFKIQKKGNTTYFYINNKQVASLPFQDFYGTRFGVVLDPSMSVSMDNLMIFNKRPPLDLVSNLNFTNAKHKLGPGVNSEEHPEIAPVISPDGQTLYFARFTYQNLSKKSYTSKTDCDIWYSKRRPDGSWGKASKMPFPVNNDGDNLVISVSADGNTLMVEGVYDDKGGYINDQGLSITHRTATGWSIPEKIKIDDFYNQNEYETYCFSTDRKVLIMAIERSDSYGAEDLYVSFRKEDNHYSKPVHLDATLNTNLGEATPYLAADNKTLYFCSQGKSGYGSMDIFVTKRTDKTWMHWSPPQNMGPKINDKGWNVYYSVAAKGDRAFLVCTGGNHKYVEDIYEIKLIDDARPDPVVLITGRVLDKKTGKPVEARIVYEEGANHTLAGEARSNPVDGSYRIVLPYGKLYRFQARAKGHLAIQNEKIDLTSESTYKEINRDLFMAPVSLGQIVQLHNVEFIRNQAVLVRSSFGELDHLADMMRSNENIKIELSGHTETQGNPGHLLDLSQKRVKVVKNYLVQHGISSGRITGKGYGGTHPLIGNKVQNQKKNRRVEVKIVGM